MGQNNARRVQRVEVRQLTSQQVVHHPPPHIQYIGRPFPKVRIFHLLHALGIGVNHMLINMLNAYFAELELAAHRRRDRAVRRHQKMRLKYLRLPLPQRFRELLLDLLNLLPRLQQGYLQPPHLPIQLLLPDRSRRYAHLFMTEND